MPWTLTSFLANRKTSASRGAPAMLASWPAEETERLANAHEQGQLSNDFDANR